MGHAPAQTCCDLQASVSESVRQALHKQKAACQAAAQVSAAEVLAAKVAAAAELGQQQAGSYARQQAGSATQPHILNHGELSDQPLETSQISSTAAGPWLNSASVVGQLALEANTPLASDTPLPTCHQHLLGSEGASSKLSQLLAHSHQGLVEPDMQMPGVGLPVESAGSHVDSSLSVQRSGEKRSKANASDDARPQLWQVMLCPLCLQLTNEPVQCALSACISVQSNETC